MTMLVVLIQPYKLLPEQIQMETVYQHFMITIVSATQVILGMGLFVLKSQLIVYQHAVTHLGLIW